MASHLVSLWNRLEATREWPIKRNKGQPRKYMTTEQARLVPLGLEFSNVIALIGPNQPGYNE